MNFDYLIVGGGVAGSSAAEAIRENDSRGSIAIVSREAHPLYSRVMLPHFINGSVLREQLFLRSYEDYNEKNIVLFLGKTASRLDIAGRMLTLESGEEIKFGKILIAAGGRPRPLKAHSENINGISRLQTIEDADRMLAVLPSRKQALVFGGGFIALEYLNVLSRRSVPSALLMRAPYFFSRHIDEVGGRILCDNFRRHGVSTIITDDEIESIIGEKNIEGVKTKKGIKISCDFLGLGIGLEKNVAWLSSSGLELTEHGVITNEFLETAAPGVFAAGDIAYFYDFHAKNHVSHGNWSNSFLQGRLAGKNMSRGELSREAYRNITSYSIKNFGIVITFIGDTFARSGLETVSRCDESTIMYERFFLQGGRVMGAILINRPQDHQIIMSLVRSSLPLAAQSVANLSDPAFDIASLIK